MTDEEVKQFFINNNGNAVCGRFKNSQIHRIIIELPQNIFHVRMPLWMRFLVACLVIFGLSIFPFETTIAGNKLTEHSFYQGEPVRQDKPVTKKKKSKRKTRFTRLQEITIADMQTLGLTVIVDTPRFRDESVILPTDAGSVPTGTIIFPDNHQQRRTEPKRDDQKKKPDVPAEFILPAALVPGKRKNHRS